MPENHQETNNTGSPVVNNIDDINRTVSVLAQIVNQIHEDVSELKREKLLSELQLPEDVLKESGLLDNISKSTRRGRLKRPILEHEIKEAKKKLGPTSEAQIAKYLGISYPSYKKYAVMYGIWNPNPSIRGKAMRFDPKRGKFPLDEILEGKHPNCPVYRVKAKLFQGGIKEEKCELCGFKEKRMVDGKVPLILNFMDGDEKNHRLENMKIYCYNCTFTSGRGYLRNGTRHFDPDWIQGKKY